MTLDHLREIALIQISQAQRTNAMTLIDTTLYANGALRLSRHGAGHGGTVLTHVPSGRQIEILDDDKANYRIVNMVQLGWRDGPIFDMIEFYERDERQRAN